MQFFTVDNVINDDRSDTNDEEYDRFDFEYDYDDY